MLRYREVTGHAGYRVGADGSVWSRWRLVKRTGRHSGTRAVIGDTWKRRKTNIHNGYEYVILKGRTLRVAHLVLRAFRGPRPRGAQCRHLNGNSLDNRLVNLAWGTPAENYDDRAKHGREPRGEAHARAKLTESLVVEIRKMRAGGASYPAIAKRFGIAISHAHRIATAKNWSHVHGE